MPKQGRGIFIFLFSIIAVGVLSLLSWVPIRVLTVMGSWLGGLYYHLDGRRKKIGMANLRLAFSGRRSEKELKGILKSVYRNMGSSALEFAALPKLNREKTERLVRVQGLEKIDTARKAGRGVILLTAHFGNWELLAQSSAIFGFPLHVIGRRANVSLLHNFIVRCRESHGNKVILRTNAMRKILHILNRGEILGVLADQRGSTSRGLMIDFFGRPAPTSPALARIILKTGAPVLPAFMVRNTDRTHTIHINDPIEITRTQDPGKDVFHLTRIYTKALEDFIRQHPDQWLWMHRRWMRRNTGGESRY